MDTNPYQLRFDLLQMAKDLLMEEWNAKRQFLERQFEENVRCANSVGSSLAIPFPDLPKVPTVDKITELATDLNSFVSRRN
jgi:hypothetical protein